MAYISNHFGNISMKKKSIISDDKYISWLENFTSKHRNFSNDSWDYSNKISNFDKEKVHDLPILFNVIADYANGNYIEAISDDEVTFTNEFYCIKFNNCGYKIGVMAGQGCFFYCERIDIYYNNFIDFNDIISGKEQPNTAVIREKLNNMSKLVSELASLPVSRSVLKFEIDKILDKIL